MPNLGSIVFVGCCLISCTGERFNGGGASNNAAPSVAESTTNDAQPVRGASPISAGPAPIDGILFQECVGHPELPFVAELYPLPTNTSSLPNFASIKSIKTLCMEQLNITNRDFKSGFPGIEGLFEWFALSIRVNLKVPKDGDYTFTLKSDDGSRLFIQDELIINNDGAHSAKSVSQIKTLKAGTYPARIDYFQGPRFSIALELKWQEPGAIEKVYIPSIYLQRP